MNSTYYYYQQTQYDFLPAWQAGVPPIHIEPTLKAKQNLVQKNILSIFQQSREERDEIFEFGLSIKSSLKDLQRLYIQFALRDFLLIQGQENPDFPRLDKLLFDHEFQQNVELYNSALEFLYNLFTNQKDSKLNITSAWELKDYFKKQLLSQLGEKSGQRRFEFEVAEEMAILLIESGYRAYNVKKCEREKIELMNMAQIYWDVLPNQIKCVILKSFPELEPILSSQSSLGELLRNNHSLIEISPPIYSHQSDVMIKIIHYDKISNTYKFEQLSLPNKNLEQILLLINSGENAVTSYSADQITHPANKVLGKIFAINSAVIERLKLQMVNIAMGAEFEDITDFYQQDKEVSERVTQVANQLEPFVDEMVDKNIPSMFTNGNEAELIEKYKQILLLATATANPNTIQSPDNVTRKEIASGQALTEFITTGNISSSVARAKINAPGDCDNLTGTIGGRESNACTQGKLVNLNPRDVENPIWMNNGKFTCPVCKAVTLDICQSECPNCSVSLKEMREAVENQSLGKLINEKRSELSFEPTDKKVLGDNLIGIILKLIFPFL